MSTRTRDVCNNGFMRRIVSLPRNIIDGFSRVMGHGGCMGFSRRRRDQNLFPGLIPDFQPQTLPEPFVARDEWGFLASFEQQYGYTHPFFYACRFRDALKIAEDEKMLIFVYLHSPQHPFTASFCRETLCSELVVQFLDANYVSWGALADRDEGLDIAATLQPGSFPFCAVVAPASCDNVAVLQQIEGPVAPAELVEILQRTCEEQGPAFGISVAKTAERTRSRRKEEEKIKADRLLREEQDAAYLSALKIDKEKEKMKSVPEHRNKKPVNSSNNRNHNKPRPSPTQNQHGKGKEAAATTWSKDPQTTQVLIRFPNGERREQSFPSSEKIQALYRYIDSLNLPGLSSYRLISSFPRKTYGIDQMGMTLREAGLHPKATLFLELVS